MKYINHWREYEIFAKHDERLFYLRKIDVKCEWTSIAAWWMKFTPEMLAKAYFSAAPGSISVLQENNYGHNMLRLLNDTSHLSQLKQDK